METPPTDLVLNENEVPFATGFWLPASGQYTPLAPSTWAKHPENAATAIETQSDRVPGMALLLRSSV